MRGLGPARAGDPTNRQWPFPAILSRAGKFKAIEETKWRHFAEKCPANDAKWAGRAVVP